MSRDARGRSPDGPAVDVVVVTYNSSDHLDRALAPLTARADLGVRVLVVDNASHDDSIDRARARGATVIANPINTGFAAAANQGVLAGTAEFVLLLNPDAELSIEALAALVGELEFDPALAVVSPRLRQGDAFQRVRWPFPTVRGAWREALGLSRLAPGDRGRDPGPAEDQPGFVIGACFLVRRAAFEAVGGFDLRFWLYGEETDLCRRLVDRGWSIRVAHVEAEHVGGASAVGIEPLVFEHFQRGAEHFVAKHEGPGRLWSLRMAQAVGSAIRMVAPVASERRALHRRRLARQVRTMIHTPGQVALDSPATAAPGVGLVVCSLEPWDEVWRRNQFLVRELLVADPARRVLFVEPPFDVVHERRRGSGRVRQRGLRPVEGDGRIVCFEPVKWWPRALGPLANVRLRRQVRRAACALGLSDPDLWVNDPSYAGLATTTAWPATYDITDDWTRAGSSARTARRTRRDERRLFAECGSVVVCSPDLAASHVEARSDLVVIPNAVDLEHLRAPQSRPADLPPAAAVAVYVGTLQAQRLDLDLLVDLARARDDLAIVLVGPDSLDPLERARIDAFANVHVLGPRPYAQVPGYLQHADVLIVPHVVTPFTESLDPIKAYECVAVGRPTVATPVAGFRGLGDPVVCVAPASFVDTVLGVLDGSAEAAAPRQASDDPAGWSERAGAFAAQLARARQRAGPRPWPAAPAGALRVALIDHCAQLSGGEIALARLTAAVVAYNDRPTDDQPAVALHAVLGEHGPLEARLAESGATVEVLALDQRVANVRKDSVGSRSFHPAGVVLAGREVLALRRRLRALQPDLVHTNSMKAHIYGGAAARLAGLPLVWHVRDRIADDYLPGPTVRVIRWLARWIPDAIIVNSRATRDTLGSVVTRGRIPVTVFNGIVEAAVDPAGPGAYRRDDCLRLAMVGRLAPWKGQDVFLAAFAQAFPTGSAHALLVGSAMFGEEEFEATLRAQVHELDLADRVTFIGFTDDVVGVMGQVDVVVHASVVAEPFGQVVVEAMAAGRPIVASALGGPAEVITDGVDGLLTPAGDVDALAERLRRLADDPALRERLGAAGRITARSFEPEIMAPQFVACLVEAVASARSRRRGGRSRRSGLERHGSSSGR